MVSELSDSRTPRVGSVPVAYATSCTGGDTGSWTYWRSLHLSPVSGADLGRDPANLAAGSDQVQLERSGYGPNREHATLTN